MRLEEFRPRLLWRRGAWPGLRAAAPPSSAAPFVEYLSRALAHLLPPMAQLVSPGCSRLCVTRSPALRRLQASRPWQRSGRAWSRRWACASRPRGRAFLPLDHRADSVLRHLLGLGAVVSGPAAGIDRTLRLAYCRLVAACADDPQPLRAGGDAQPARAARPHRSAPGGPAPRSATHRSCGVFLDLRRSPGRRCTSICGARGLDTGRSRQDAASAARELPPVWRRPFIRSRAPRRLSRHEDLPE